MLDDPDEPSLLVAPALASHASSSAFEIWPSLLVSMAEKLDDEPEEDDDPPVELPSLDEADEPEEVDATLVSVEALSAGGGGGGMLSFMKDESSDCDTDPSPSVSIAATSFEASLLDVDEAFVVDDDPSESAEDSSDCETLPSPLVSSAAKSRSEGSWRPWCFVSPVAEVVSSLVEDVVVALVVDAVEDDAVLVPVLDEPASGGGGGGGMSERAKVESSLWEMDPSPSVSIALNACAEVAPEFTADVEFDEVLVLPVLPS